ncbi:glycoside hydrolase family 81 protein [Exidia glandulosa HHB12029]|uniref:glucan endo-1,3-beta-D-glucosidase n=1 Tax=Exidia glandulosa HHB12029 TaxID=1314781 RepID=A0A165Q0C5_EXIGL|nr:glycoside hydrolase family 81 protein [Exidia glandulosa HHB12029]
MAHLRHSFIFLTILFSAVRGVLDPISVAEPKLAGGTVANNAPPGPFFQDFKPPFPTNAWWSGFAAVPQNARVIGPVPYASICTNDSFQFGLSTSEQRRFDGTSVHQASQLDYGLSFVEHESGMDTHKASGWDTQSLSIDFFTKSGNSSMRMFLVPGSPYMTAQFSASTPLFTSLAGVITSLNGVLPSSNVRAVNVTATKFKIVNAIGTYLIYSLNGAITLNVDAFAMTVKASAPFTGVLRFAKMDLAPFEKTLDTYAADYATGVETDYTFNGNQADLIFTWNVVGDPTKLLMLTYPHHRRAMVSPNFLPLTSLAIMTLKGWMYPTIGDSWTMRYTLTDIDFNAPRPPDASCLGALIKGLEYEVAHMGDPEQPGDFYNWGNHIAALSRLGLIADEVSRPDLVQQVVQHLKATIAHWGDPSYTNVQAAYETNWGGVANKAGAGSVFVDFGNGQYNDHNLQYGYFLNAGAVIAKFDPSWLNATNGVGTNADMLSFIARDIANPSPKDPFFPVVRHRDWFAGHSWASGIANGAGSRDQESSTEGINAFYGTLLYSIVTGQKQLEQFARLLLKTEQVGSQTYWHLYPNADPNDRDEPYPEAGARSLVTIGNLEDEQAGAWLFWGAERVEIAAIQILPVTPVNEDLYDAVWVQNVLNYTANELADPTMGDAWKSVIYLAYSNFNPQKAALLSTTLASWGSGNSYSNQVYFTSTRPNPSGKPICASSQLNPEGIFLIQDVESGKFVTSTPSQPDLTANADHSSDASLFQLSFMPGGGSMQNFATGMFVTADPNAQHGILAGAAVPSTWEMLTAVPDPSGEEGVFNLRSGSNLLWIDSSSGSLVNSATTQAAASKLRIVPPPPPQGTFLLQDTQSGQFVQASGDDPTLVATVSTSQEASAFAVSSNSDGTTIQLLSTGQFVSATPSTDDPLQATRGEAR